jgi:hypothetical protein
MNDLLRFGDSPRLIELLMNANTFTSFYVYQVCLV